jgi:hypothetical protein
MMIERWADFRGGEMKGIWSGRVGSAWVIVAVFLALLSGTSLQGESLSLISVVTPSTVIEKNGQVVKFAIHGYIEFKSLAEVFPYIE